MSTANISADVGATRAALVVMRLSRAIGRLDTGLTLPQYNILAAVSAGGERSARLAERLAVAKPTLTAVADGLVEMGCLTREAEPGDRRVVRLHLTAAGREALERADAVYDDWFTRLFAETGEPETMTRALSLLVGTMDERRRQKAYDLSKDGA